VYPDTLAGFRGKSPEDGWQRKKVGEEIIKEEALFAKWA